MKYYDLDADTIEKPNCEIFNDWADYDECLDAIKKWWATVERPYKYIRAIMFSGEESGEMVAEVYWVSAAEEKIRLSRWMSR